MGLLLPCPFHWNQSCIYMYKCIVSYISLCSPLGVLYKILHLPLALPQKYQNSWALWHWRCVSISRLRYVSDDSTNISQVFIYKHKFIYLNGSYEEGGRGMTSFLAKTWIISFGWRIVGRGGSIGRNVDCGGGVCTRNQIALTSQTLIILKPCDWTCLPF